MTDLLEQNKATAIPVGPFVGADGKTPLTDLNVIHVELFLIKDSDTHPLTAVEFSPATGGSTHDMQHIIKGWYSLELTATDVDTLGILKLGASITGTEPVWNDFRVVSDNVYSSLVDNTDILNVRVSGTAVPVPNVNVTQWNSQSVTGSAGFPDVNVRQWQSVAPNSLQAGRVDAYFATGSAGAANQIRDAVTGGAYALDTDASGRVTLAADGLDQIPVTDPGGVASTFPQMLVQLWRRFFRRTKLDISANELYTYADNGTTVRTTQSITESATEQDMGAAS